MGIRGWTREVLDARGMRTACLPLLLNIETMKERPRGDLSSESLLDGVFDVGLFCFSFFLLLRMLLFFLLLFLFVYVYGLNLKKILVIFVGVELACTCFSESANMISDFAWGFTMECAPTTNTSKLFVLSVIARVFSPVAKKNKYCKKKTGCVYVGGLKNT